MNKYTQRISSFKNIVKKGSSVNHKKKALPDFLEELTRKTENADLSFEKLKINEIK